MAKKSAQKKSSSAGKSQPKPAPSTKASRAASRAAGANAAAGGRVAELQSLISLMVEKDVVEVEIEEAGSRWRIRRAEPHAVAYATSAPMPMAMAHAPMAHAPMSHAPAAHGAATGHAAAEPAGEVFKSPMVGTFYRAPSPEAEVFCKPGDRVSAERTICIIEAMKVMNEIKAEREFEILDILVKNGESVEFGQPLFLIR